MRCHRRLVPRVRLKPDPRNHRLPVLAFVFAVCILAVGGLAVIVSGEFQSFVDLFPK